MERVINKDTEENEEDIAVFTRVVQRISHSREPPTDLPESPSDNSRHDDQASFGNIVSSSDTEMPPPPRSPPLGSEYASRLKFQEIFEQKIRRLEDRIVALEQKQILLNLSDLTLSPKNQTLLDNRYREKRELEDNLKLLKMQLYQIKKNSVSRATSRVLGEPFMDRESKLIFAVEVNLDPQDKSSEFVKFPLLLPPPGSAVYDPPISRLPDHRTTSPIDAASRINM
jgi:hypothetical protein